MDDKLPFYKEKAADILYQSEKARLIDTQERNRRMNRLKTARALAEIEPLIQDLRPGAAPGGPAPERGNSPLSAPQQISTILGSQSRRHNWLDSNHVKVSNVLGESTLDFSAESLPSRVITLETNIVLGQVKVLVPPGMSVVAEITPVLGEVNIKKDIPARDYGSNPVLRIRGAVVLGELKIREA